MSDEIKNISFLKGDDYGTSLSSVEAMSYKGTPTKDASKVDSIESYLASVKARADAATPGPWSHDDGHMFVDEGVFEYPGKGWIKDPVSWRREEEDYDKMYEDADFIAAARTDVPMLLDLVEAFHDDLLFIQNHSTTSDVIKDYIQKRLKARGEEILRSDSERQHGSAVGGEKDGTT